MRREKTTRVLSRLVLLLWLCTIVAVVGFDEVVIQEGDDTAGFIEPRELGVVPPAEVTNSHPHPFVERSEYQPPPQLLEEVEIEATTTTTTFPTKDEGEHEKSGNGGQQGKRVRVVNSPRLVVFQEVVDNLWDNLPEATAETTSAWGHWFLQAISGMIHKVRQAVSPQVNVLIRQLEPPAQEVRQAVCRSGSGLDACAVMNVSWAVAGQLWKRGQNLSDETVAWLAEEVPRLKLPFHLVWVDVETEVAPVEPSQARNIILRQKPYRLTLLTDFFSSAAQNLINSIPYLPHQYLPNLFWYDPACPLVQHPDGTFSRVGPDGYCHVRPCEEAFKIDARADAEWLCRCPPQEKRCILRVDPLRDFELLVDGSLENKPVDSRCRTQIANLEPPSWICDNTPKEVCHYLRQLPRYLLNFLVGLLLLFLAPSVAEWRILHYTLSACFGLMAVVGLGLVIVNNMVKRLQHNLQHVPAIVTVIVGALSMYSLQRASPISSHPLAVYLTWAQFFWSSNSGKGVVIGSFIMGIFLTWYFGWFSEDEIDAKDRGGWLATCFNGQANIRRAMQWTGLGFLMRSVPNPDYAIWVVILGFYWDYITHMAWRVYMFMCRSPDTSRYVARGYDYGKGVGSSYSSGGQGASDYTRKELQKLREVMNNDQSVLKRLSEAHLSKNIHFRDGFEHVQVDHDEPAEARSSCLVM